MNPIVFLIDTLLNIYIFILLLRFLLQQVGADFYNPVSQFIVKITQKPVFIARRIIPGLRGMDLATLSLALLFTVLKIFLVSVLQGHQVSVIAILIYSIPELLILAINIFIISIVIQAILSWVNPDPYNPIITLLHQLTNPVLRPVRRLIPVIEGIDLSPIAALIGLAFIKYTINYLLLTL